MAKFIEVTNTANKLESFNPDYVSVIDTSEDYETKRMVTRVWIMNRDIMSAVKTFESYESVMQKINSIK